MCACAQNFSFSQLLINVPHVMHWLQAQSAHNRAAQKEWAQLCAAHTTGLHKRSERNCVRTSATLFFLSADNMIHACMEMPRVTHWLQSTKRTQPDCTKRVPSHTHISFMQLHMVERAIFTGAVTKPLIAHTLFVLSRYVSFKFQTNYLMRVRVRAKKKEKTCNYIFPPNKIPQTQK